MEAQVPDGELDSRLLLLEAFGLSLSEFFLKRNDKLNENDPVILEKREQYEKWLDLRKNRIPLQHLTGAQEFMGLEFRVNCHVLIPRQDTETLAELVLKHCREKEICLLDMCTGSGCLAVSLSVLGQYKKVYGADISREALDVAWENVKACFVKNRLNTLGDNKWQARVTEEGKDGSLQSRTLILIESDLFENLDKEVKFDVIVSNPPYIATKVIEGLEPEVRDYEPINALDGREDGLFFYRRIAVEAKGYLKEKGKIFLEIGYDQGEAVSQILSEHKYKNIHTEKDAAGNSRVVWAEAPEA